MKLADAIRQTRRTHNLTQADFAAACGISRARLSVLEQGRRTPTTAELARLQAYLKPELLADTDWELPGAVTISADFQAPPPPAARPAFAFQTFLERARKVYGRVVAGLERQLPRDSRLRFLRELWVDSALEAVYWLQVGAECRGATRGCLQSLGMRAHPILCPATETVIGDLARDCLVLDEGLLFPQVTVGVGARHYRLDCLACVGPGRWLNIEIDGSGHDRTWDERRDAELKIPVWRFRDRDILDPNFATELRRRLAQFR